MSETALPKVSVLMPAHNCEGYIRGAIDSILGQSFTDFELVIIDDGSTDKTTTIIADISAKDRRIRYHRIEKAGLVEALNIGLALCQSDYVVRMDADDISRFDRISHLYSAMTDGNYVALGSFVTNIDSEGKILGVGRAPLSSAHPESIHAALMRSSYLLHPTVIMRKSAVHQVGGYRSHFPSAEDYDLWLRLSRLGPISNLPLTLLQYRIHPKSITSSNTEQQALSTAAALADYLEIHIGSANNQISRNRSLNSIKELCSGLEPSLRGLVFVAYLRAILYGNRIDSQRMGGILKELLDAYPMMVGHRFKIIHAHVVVRGLSIARHKLSYREILRLSGIAILKHHVRIVLVFAEEVIQRMNAWVSASRLGKR